MRSLLNTVSLRFLWNNLNVLPARSFWAVKMFFFFAAWAEIWVNFLSTQIAFHRGGVMYDNLYKLPGLPQRS
jgi:hypothetical protein